MKYTFPKHPHCISKVLAAAFTWAAGAAISSAVSVTALSGGNVVTFDSANPGSFVSTMPVSGVVAGQTLVGLDYRPADGNLIGVGYNAATGAIGIYTLDTATGLAVGINLGLSIPAGLSMVTADFNPAANAIRVVTSGASGNNLRITMGGLGTVMTDTTLSPAQSTFATAYSYNVAGGGNINNRTTLYEINSTHLVTQGSIDFYTGNGASPNGGLITEIAVLTGISGPSVVDFDIYSTSSTDAGTAYISDGNSFFTMDLATGAATSLGTLQFGISRFAVIPEPGSVLLLGAAAVGGLLRRGRRIG